MLTTARALGEFGAVSVVSGRIEGQTQTLPLYVQDRFENFDATGAYTAAVVLALLALATLVAMNLLTRRTRTQDGGLMAIEVRNVSKRFGDFVALDDVSVTRRRRRADGAAGTERQRQVDAAADHRGPGDAGQRQRGDRRARTSPSTPRAAAAWASSSSTTRRSST